MYFAMCFSQQSRILSQRVCLKSIKKMGQHLRVSPEVCNLGVPKPLNIQTMHFTKVQISELMRKHAEKENGLHDLFEIMLESMMVAERSEFLHKHPQNKGNGYRLGHTYGQGRKLEFRVTAMVTSILRYLLFFAIRKKNVTVWQVFCIPKALRRNRLVMSLTRFMASTIPNPA